jgi:heme-degrading monooxygenase HmoA
MYMRIIWGKVRAGQWDGYEAAYKKAIELTKGSKGFKGRWLVRNLDDPDSGYSITLWETERDMRSYLDSRQFREQILPMLQPFWVNQYTVTHCEVRASD